MDEFPNNSQRAKNPGYSKSEPTEVDKHIEKIILGEATIRKPSWGKRVRNSFIVGDASSVSEHVFWNLLIPSAKDALSNMGSTFIDMMIYGEKHNRIGPNTPTSGFGSNSRINYGSISTGSRLVLGPQQNNPTMEPVRDRFNPNEIIVPTRAEAEGIINKMFEVLEKYKVVTVSDLYRMVGVSSEHNYMDNRWGWVNLDSADVRRVREGVLLVLPPPQDLN